MSYGFNYDIEKEPFYEFLPENIPSETKMLEFLYHYLMVAEPNLDNSQINEKAKGMLNV